MKRTDAYHLSFYLLTSICLLSACAPYRFNNPKAAVCNELNSQIIFNGSTSNIRNANIQNAQKPLRMQSYDKKCE